MPANFVIATPTVDAEFSAAGTGADNCRSERTSPAPVDCPAMETPHNQLLLADEQKMYDIEKPHHHDVLCGRGVTTNRHPGNESFRSLVSLNKVRKEMIKNCPGVKFQILCIVYWSLCRSYPG